MHGTFSAYSWDVKSLNWIFRKTVFNLPCTYSNKVIGSYHISMSAIRNVWADYCFVYLATDTEAKCWICCAGCHRHSAHASPKPAWKRWIVVFGAIKRLPKFSISAAAHIADCTRLCNDWAQAPVYRKWNNTAGLLHSLPSGSARPARRSLRHQPPQTPVFTGTMIWGLVWVGYCSIVAENQYNGLAVDLKTQRWPSAGWCPAATPSAVTLTPIALSVHCSLHAAGMLSSALLSVCWFRLPV